MKKALVLVLTIAALLVSPGLQKASANAPDGDGLPESVVPSRIEG